MRPEVRERGETGPAVCAHRASDTAWGRHVQEGGS